MIELTFQVAIFILECGGKRQRDAALDKLILIDQGVLNSIYKPKRRRSFAPPAHSKLQRGHQRRQQCSARRNIVGDDVLMRCVCAIALDTQPIEDGHSQRSDKVSV